MTSIGSRVAIPRFTGMVGIGQRDVTPPVGIRVKNWGPAQWEVSEGNHNRLVVTALAVASTGGRPHLVLGADAAWWRRVDDEGRFRSRVKDALGLGDTEFTFTLSHTHAGPLLTQTETDLAGGDLLPGYLETFTQAAIEAAGEAIASLAPGSIEFVEGACGVASNRELDAEGRAIVGFNPDSDDDNDLVLVGRVSTVESGVIGTIVNYACHPTTLAWQNRLVSPDYVGAMRDLVEQQTGSPCLFLQGASGELAPREQYTGDTGVADRHGLSLGHAVLAALGTLPSVGTELELVGVVESGAPLAMWEPVASEARPELDAVTGVVTLDLVHLPTIDELETQWADIDPFSRRERITRARNLRDGWITGPTVEHPVWVTRLGDAFFVGHPGEAYSRLQKTLRARFPDYAIVVMNLTNGPGFAYLPTADAYDRGAYQAWQTPFAAGSLDRVEERATELITQILQEN